MSAVYPPAVHHLIDLALSEDLGHGDITSAALLDDAREVEARFVARERLVVSGLGVAALVLQRRDCSIVDPIDENGEWVEAGETLARAVGSGADVLAAERTALNFLQRLSGIATTAKRYAEAVKGTQARVVDTRKTLPGYRYLSKRAVRTGGLHNHRADLASGILIKDNHIAALGSVTAAVERARDRAPHSLRIEIEVDTLEQLDEALAASADVVLLDNMTADEVRDGVARAHDVGVLVEVSGGINLDTVRAYADAGADIISVGALTHSAPAVDIALDV